MKKRKEGKHMEKCIKRKKKKKKEYKHKNKIQVILSEKYSDWSIRMLAYKEKQKHTAKRKMQTHMH